MKHIDISVSDGKIYTDIRNESGWCHEDAKCGEFKRALENLILDELKGNDKVLIDFSMIIQGRKD